MDGLATPAQIRYIEQLHCQLRRGSELRELDLNHLTKQEAGKLIGKLQNDLKKRKAREFALLPGVPRETREKWLKEAEEM